MGWACRKHCCALCGTRQNTETQYSPQSTSTPWGGHVASIAAHCAERAKIQRPNTPRKARLRHGVGMSQALLRTVRNAPKYRDPILPAKHVYAMGWACRKHCCALCGTRQNTETQYSPQSTSTPWGGHAASIAAHCAERAKIQRP